MIVGAGPTGLAVAIGFGGPCTVIERRREVGGLSASIEIDGAMFDVGGHSFWTPHPEVRRLVYESVAMVEQRRHASCWHQGAWIDYPFQRHFGQLPDERVREECRRGLAAADGGAGAAHFGEYVVRRFGAGVAEHFLLPYNRKLWARDLSRLATDWTAERVAAPSRDSEPALGMVDQRSPLQEDTRVAYPASGGFGEICRALARRVAGVRVGVAVERINLNDRTLVLADGAVLAWKRLVCTNALPELLARIPEIPTWLLECASGLEYVSLRVLFVVVDGPVDRELQRAYVADPVILAHKIALNHNSSPTLRARPRHAIVAEISYSDEKPLPAGDLGRHVVRDLMTLGLVRHEQDVLRTDSIDIKYGYPVPTHDRVARVREIQSWLAARGVITLGRFGAWEYVNSDQCMHQGLALGRSVA
ncbi:MAG: protoporphyrinogen/coproporphyrinogen oxidase, partial [Vicinamibacterales bacterium]